MLHAPPVGAPAKEAEEPAQSPEHRELAIADVLDERGSKEREVIAHPPVLSIGQLVEDEGRDAEDGAVPIRDEEERDREGHVERQADDKPQDAERLHDRR